MKTIVLTNSAARQFDALPASARATISAALDAYAMHGRGDVKALARAAVDAGADLVIGHGPHVLRAMEVYRGRLIAYSLGNFVGYRQFGTRGGHGGTSVVLQTELADNGVLISARLHPMMLDSEGIPRPDPDGSALPSIQELSDADFPGSGVRVASDGTLSW